MRRNPFGVPVKTSIPVPVVWKSERLHVTPRIWDAASLFHPKGSDEAFAFVKDRVELGGMRWTIEGAQAMLDLRSVALNGDWNGFTQYRIQRETERLYPYAEVIGTVEWPLPLAA